MEQIYIYFRHELTKEINMDIINFYFAEIQFIMNWGLQNQKSNSTEEIKDFH